MSDARTYKWGGAAVFYGLHKVPVEAAVELTKRLAKEGRLTPAAVKEEAARKDHPLHPASGWYWDQDAAAAEQWRLQVARNVISAPRVVAVEYHEAAHDPDETGVPVWVQAGKSTIHGRGSTYRRTEDVMKEPYERAQYLTQLLNEIARLERQRALLLSYYPEIRDDLNAVRRRIEATLRPDHPDPR